MSALPSRQPIVVLIASKEEEDVRQSYLLGADAYVAKAGVILSSWPRRPRR